MPSSISSSGHADGLGRRVLAFDRETGAMLERLHVRPELAAFEAALRDRVAQLSTLNDERIARPTAVERDPSTGELVVVSGFVAGCRLAELLDAACEQSAVPGLDVALGYLLAALPGLSALHTFGGFAHGLIDPGRTVLTAEGQVVLLDAAFGASVERLRLSRRRLWCDFGVAAPDGYGPAALDATTDIAQMTLNALMLVLGRKVRGDEYPDGIASLLMEVVDVAQIRGSTGLASTLQRILQRSLPLPGRRPYRSSDEMVVDVRQLVRRELGMDVCRKALTDFVMQMDATGAVAPAPLPVEVLEYGEFDEEEDENEGSSRLSTALEFEVPLDAALGDRDGAREAESVYDLSAFPSASRRSPDTVEPSAPAEPLPPPAPAEPRATPPPAIETRAEEIFEIAIPEPAITIDITPAELPRLEQEWNTPPDPPSFQTTSASDAASDATWSALAGHTAETLDDVASAQENAADEWHAASTDAVTEGADPARDPDPSAAPAHESRSSRRKRQQAKSARARKDKLRSTNEPAKTADSRKAEPPPAAAGKETKSGWLVPPDRAARFEPAVETSAPPPPPPPRPVAPPLPAYPQPAAYAPPAPAYPQPAQPVFAPPPPVSPQHSYQAAPSAPAYGVPGLSNPAGAAPAVVKVEAPALKLKAEPPAGFAPARSRRAESIIDRSVLEPVTALSHAQRGAMFEARESRGFPWKLATAAVVIIAAVIFAGRAYLPGGIIGTDTARATEQAETPHATDPAPAPPSKPAAPPAKGMGQIAIETQPAGARVLIDGKPAGESPLTVDVPPGRHMVTLTTQSGTVMRTVRVAAGKTASLDVPIYSGWVAVFSPVALEIAENGQSLGTTEQNRIMLSPGRHTLTLRNPDLDYSQVQEVDIEPGEVRSITVTPRGQANFNAEPWAEVWMDGQKLGDTPIANYELPLGLRVFTFKHPQFGERTVTTTIRGKTPTAVSVDFTRQD